MSNFRDIAGAFLRKKAALQVEDKSGLKKALLGLIKDEAARQELGKRAREILDGSMDSVEENLAVVKKFI
jgi:3-deoxy-D-manno-octulosonic-acid transferase